LAARSCTLDGAWARIGLGLGDDREKPAGECLRARHASFARRPFGVGVRPGRERGPVPNQERSEFSGCVGIEEPRIRWTLFAVDREVGEIETLAERARVLDECAPSLEEGRLHDCDGAAHQLNLGVAIEKTDAVDAPFQRAFGRFLQDAWAGCR